MKSENKRIELKGIIRTLIISILVAFLTLCAMHSKYLDNEQNYLELENEISKFSNFDEIVSSSYFESISLDDVGYKVVLIKEDAKVYGYFDSNYSYIGNLSRNYDLNQNNYFFFGLILYTLIYFVFINVCVYVLSFIISIICKTICKVYK